MPWLDIGRLLAALAVAMAHLSLIFKLGWNDTWATVALSWFFVLSGFIMAHAHPDCRPVRKVLVDFWLRRIIRIVPAYWIFLILSAVWFAWGIGQYGVHWFQIAGRPEFLTFDIASSAYLSDWQTKFIDHFLFLGAFDEASSGRYLFSPPLWSLYSEMFFYLLFPFLMPLVLYIKKEWGLSLAFVLWLAQGVIIFVCVEQLPNRDFVTTQAIIYSNPLVRLIEFVIGILACHWLSAASHSARQRLRHPIFIGMNLIALVGIIMIAPKIPTPFNLYWIAVPLLLWNILILSQIKFTFTRFSVVAGGSSYIIYLIHWTLWEMAHALDVRIDSPSVTLGLMIALIILSILLWLFIDQPVRNWLYVLARNHGLLNRRNDVDKTTG